MKKMGEIKAQIESIKQTRERYQEVEARRIAEKQAELEKSRKMYESCVQKMQRSAANYYPPENKPREKSLDVDTMLASYQERMQKCTSFFLTQHTIAEKLAGRRKREIVELASQADKRLKNALERVREQQTQSLSPVKMQRMLRKYERIAGMAQKKREEMHEKSRKHREECCTNLTRLADTRKHQEKVEEEWKTEVERKREDRERHAEVQKNVQLERMGEVREQRRQKMEEVKRNLSSIRCEEEAVRHEIRERERARDHQLELLRMQSRQLETVKDQVALQIRMHQAQRVDNPYVLVERRTATTEGGKRRCWQARKSNVEVTTSFNGFPF